MEHVFRSQKITYTMLRMLYFTASWCSPCRAFGPVVDSVANSYQGISYQKIDIDSSSDLVNTYGITSVPTIVLEKNGAQIARRSGAMSQSQLATFLEQHR